MELLKKSSNKQKNPLRIAFVLLVLYGLLGVISLCQHLLSSGMSYIITIKPSMIVLLLIDILFVFCYFKKSIWAFWLAAAVYPVITYFTYIMDSPSKREWVYLIIINVLIFGYLGSKLEGYLNFIKKDIKSNEIGGDEISEMNHLKDKGIKSFSFLAWGAVGAISFQIYRIYRVSQLPEGFRGAVETELRAIMIIVLATTFLFFYYKKSMLSWWTILFFGPLTWISYYLQYPFEWKPFLIMFFVWIVICIFLIRKYEDYKLYMKREK